MNIGAALASSVERLSTGWMTEGFGARVQVG
jgi:hypothetical protein